jgi:hypothetical protein
MIEHSWSRWMLDADGTREFASDWIEGLNSHDMDCIL